MLENMLNRPWRNMFTLLTDENGASTLVANKGPDLRKGFIIDKHDPYLVTFPAYTDGVLIKINILNIHVTKFRHPDTCGVNCPDNQFVSRILNRFDQTKNLIVFEVFYFLMLEPGTLDPA